MNLYRPNLSGFKAICALLVTLSPVGFGPLAAGQNTLQGLGGLTPGSIDSMAMAISDDGSTVVGASSSASGYQAFRFRNGAMEALGFVGDDTGDSNALGVSSDGAHVVGSTGPNTRSQQAFIWSEAGGMRGLGYLAGGRDDSVAFAVSSDGTIVVGKGTSSRGSEAFISSSGNPMTLLHPQEGSSFSNSGATSISADGQVVAGFSNRSRIDLTPSAFLWSMTSYRDLGTLPEATAYSLVNAISPDGLNRVGWSACPEGVQAVLWADGQPIRGLGDLPGGQFMSAARDVSGDGSIVVGYSQTKWGSEAFIWAPEMGMVRMTDFLTAAGIDVASWILVDASGVSRDGNVFCGTGINPDGETEAWMVSLSSDSDGDGIPDEDDAFPDSNMSPTLMVGSFDVGVPNLLLPDGATLTDLILAARQGARNDGQFSSSVARMVNEWIKQGYVPRAAKGAIQSAAARTRL